MNKITRTQQIVARKNQTNAALQDRIKELESANAKLVTVVINQKRRIWRLTRLTVIN